MAVVEGRIKVIGAKELRREIRKAKGPELKAKLRAVYKSSAEIVVTRAKSEAPYLSGDLQGSVRPMSTFTKAVVAVGKGRTLDYAGRRIFGDPVPGVHGDDFPYRALEREWPDVYEFFVEAIEDIGKQISTR